MDIGLKISLSGHALFIAAMLIAGPLFDAEAEDALKVTSVSLISGDELSQLEEGAAFLPPEPIPEPEPEPEPEAEPETPPEPEPENQSDLGLAADEENSGELSEELPEEDLTTQTRQSDRVAPIEVEEAPELTTSEQELEPEATPEIIPEDTPPSPTEATEAPILDQPEATSEISPDTPRPETASPVKTARPRARPDDLTAPEPEEPEAEPEPQEPEPVPEPEPAPEEPDAESETPPAPVPETEENEPQRLGSRLSQAERSEVILAVERCWNPPAGVENAEDLRVVLGMDMDRNGAPRGQPVLLSPTGAGISNLHQRAFEAARRAIIRCAPFPLPADKYETWKRIEMTFNPKDLVLH